MQFELRLKKLPMGDPSPSYALKGFRGGCLVLQVRHPKFVEDKEGNWTDEGEWQDVTWEEE